MTDSLNKCKANETPACCCVDVGTIIDNEDCTAEYEHVFASESEAQAKLVSLTQAAKDAATEPCEINSSIDKVAEGFKLTAKFTFCCGAECLIFQLKLR
ncbi:YfcZ/YiiS family protein [Gilliamella sp. B2969]|uniref:YfcZ/YiiS family protein n=1 Tax=Gilliamella sp. B2969 TaxID=2818021 RepID=UPI00226A59A8|nr:YfcZ/YiiS family protein [Gilliamella sp. B2969]MCX8730433.1 YfcZ/YiiS family protein [Gilliamella sp. B2969]